MVFQGGSPPPKSWIADVKAAQATLGTREVLIEGDVVDIRSTSPASSAGFYRIIDASDPEGVLIRTARLPRDGGELRIQARLAGQQPAEGPPVLDELDQQRIDSRPVAPLVVGVSSLAMLLIVAVLLIRAGIAERRYRLSPPLWLLPEAGPYGKSLALPNETTPALQYAPELEEADRVQREQLLRKKRSLFRALLGSTALAAASVAWFVTTKPAQAQVPEFIFIAANDTPIPVAVSPAVAESAQAVLDSLILAMRNQPGPDRPATQPTAPRVNTPVVRESLPPASPPPVFTPPPAPAPAPSPPPPAPAPAPKEEPPPRDPEADRVTVSQILAQAAGRLVDAINGKRLDNVARMLPEGISGDLGRRDRFMKLLKDYSPRATLGPIEGTTLADNTGEVRFNVQFEWRGEFGVGNRKTGRFAGIASWSGGEWRVEGARLMNALP
jgi:hypothetical protein